MRLPPSLLAVPLVGLLLSLFLATPLHAQTADDVLRFSLREPATSARALGLGGAGTAGWADLNALQTNPAGLGYYTTSEVAGGLNVLAATDASTYQVGADAPLFEQDNTESAVYPGPLSIAYKVPTQRGSLVFGLGYTQTSFFDRTLSYNGENESSSITDTFLPRNNEYEVDEEGMFFPDDIPSNIIPFIAFQGGAIEFFQEDYDEGFYPFEQAVLPGTPIRQEGLVQREGRLNEMNFSGAVEAAPNVMIGGSANIIFGRYFFEHRLTEIDQGDNADYEVLRNGQFYTGLDRMTFRERFESNLSGINLRLGVSANAIPHVRIGFTAETPSWLSVEEDFTDAIIRTDFLDGGSLAYGDDPNEEEGQGSFDYNITTPWRLGAGLAFDLEPLRITADVEFMDWSNLSLDSNSFDFPTENDIIDQDFGPVFNWRGGLEYQLAFGPTLRGGAAYRPDPRQYDVTFADGETYDRSRLFFSAGASIPFGEQFAVDLGWMQERTKDQFVPYSSITPPNEADPIAVPFVDEDVMRNQVSVNLRYSF